MKSYLVGGAVRDQLLNIPISEKDWVVVGGTAEDMLAQGFLQVGKEFPVFLHPNTHEEYALARTERKTGHGYHGFTTFFHPSVTLEEDLQRRDLTINAMALDEEGKLIDPYHGKEDLEHRILRHISPAFSDDPLRVLRVARFAAKFSHLAFTIAGETVKLMQSIVHSGELRYLSAERIWMECLKALQTPNPSVFFTTLKEVDALSIIFPEIDNLFGVPQSKSSHPEIDCGLHAMLVLDQAAHLTNNPVVRFAALTHDIGKGQTPKSILPKHANHEIASIALIKQMANRLKIPNKFTELALLVAEFHSDAHRIQSLPAEVQLTFLEKTDAFRRPERFHAFLTACEADFQGRLGFSETTYESKIYLAKLLAGCQAIDIQIIINDTMSNQAKAHAIQAARLAMIDKIIMNKSN